MGWLGSANLLVKPIWFVFITAFCMRILGVDGYGVFSTALALAAVMAAFSDFGTTRFVVREIARDRTIGGYVYTNVLISRAVLTTGAFLLAIGAGLVLGYRGPILQALFFASWYAFGLSLVVFYRGVLQGFEALRNEARSLYVEKGFVIALGLVLLIATRDPRWTLAGMAGGMTLTLIYCLVVVHREFASFERHAVDLSYIRKHAVSIGTLGLASIFALLYLKVDLVMIERILGERPAGEYGAAYRIVEALNMLPAIATAAIYPRLSSLHAEADRLGQLARSSAAGLSAIAIVIAAVLTLAAPALFQLLAPGGEFYQSGPTLSMLAWTFPFVCANAIIYAALLSLQQERFAVAALAGVLIFNVVSNWIVIPIYGVIGSAATTVATEGLLFLLYLSRLRSVLRVTPTPSIADE